MWGDNSAFQPHPVRVAPFPFGRFSPVMRLMKTCTLCLLVIGWLAPAWGETTISSTHRYAWAANLGWLDWQGNVSSGAVLGDYVCSGYIYSANAGWIHLGSGQPTNQIRYQNNSAADFGVNHDGLGNLRGYAWGANIGWINFENVGAPKVDLLTGKLSGHAWSANCGWISLSNAVAHVQTDSIQPGSLAPNGLPIAWLQENFGTTSVNAGADADNDGASNVSEYLAGTDPNDGNDVLRITSFSRGNASGTYNTLAWPGKATRFYSVQYRATFDPSDAWVELFTVPTTGVVSVGFDRMADQEFYRIRAFRPLTPF